MKIGVVQGLSGPPAITDFGESYLQGIKSAVKDYEATGGKHKIELVVYDDEANPQKAVSLVQRLMQNDKVPVIIGTVSSGNVLAFAPIMQKAGVPLVAGPSIATNITAQFINETPSYIFRCSMVEKFQIENMLDWGVKTFKKIGLVHSTTGYAVFAAKEIQEGLKARNVQLVAVELAAPNVSDLTPQLLKMKEAGAELVLNFHESFELIYRPMSKLAYKPTVAGNWGLSSQKVLQIVGQQEIEGTVMGQALDMSLDASKAFVAKNGERVRQGLPLAGHRGARLRRRPGGPEGDRHRQDHRSQWRQGRARGRRRHQGHLGDATQAVRSKRPRMPGQGARVPRCLEERTGRAAELLMRGAIRTDQPLEATLSCREPISFSSC